MTKSDLSKSKIVMLFGTFDGLHEGHRNLFAQAREYGELVVVVAPDSTVLALKKSPARILEKERCDLIRKEDVAKEVIVGDDTLNTWKVLEKYSPDIIALGYDQKELESSLRDYLKKLPSPPKIIALKPHKESVFHSRFLYGKK